MSWKQLPSQKMYSSQTVSCRQQSCKHNKPAAACVMADHADKLVFSCTCCPVTPSCRLGADWIEKKSICNKFVQSGPVTCICWPAQHHNEVVFGLADGKVKLGMLKTNKTYNMYAHPEGSYVVSVAASSSGGAVISGHIDGSIYKFTFPDQEGGQGLGHSKLLQHSCTPYALAWGSSICVAGNDSRVSGAQLQMPS